jgi:2-dehydro-3-deoxyphosphogluconate aldolase/(4S)-4-hydroxy-2-oxoglutarate aldolase
MTAIAELAKDRVLVVVRAPTIPDAAELCAALAAGGIRYVELTFTTPDLTKHLRRAAEAPGCHVGAGTVRTAAQALAAIDAGAEFLVTPGLRPDVADVAAAHRVPLVLGALTPSEVMTAADLGAAAVKVFPAHLFGPGYLRDLHGPLPDVRLIPSGGVTPRTAADFLAHGAFAVSVGSDVAPPAVVAAGDWAALTERARQLTAALP